MSRLPESLPTHSKPNSGLVSSQTFIVVRVSRFYEHSNSHLLLFQFSLTSEIQFSQMSHPSQIFHATQSFSQSTSFLQDMAHVGGAASAFLQTDPSERTHKRPRKMSSKRPPNAFLLFCRDRRHELCSKCPNLKAPEVTALLSHLWRTLDEDAKERYRQSAMTLSHCSCEIEAAPEPVSRTLEKSKPVQGPRVHFPLLEPGRFGPAWCNFSIPPLSPPTTAIPVRRMVQH